MVRNAVNLIFVMVINASILIAVFTAIVLFGVMRGTIDVLWLVRLGLILEVLGVVMFALEYIGSKRFGRGPIWWWLRKLELIDTMGASSDSLLRQATLLLMASVVVGGITLQFVSSFS